MRVPITYASPDDAAIFIVSVPLNFSVNTVTGMMTCRGRRGSLSAKLGVACWGRLGTVYRKFSPVAYRGRRDVVRGKLPRYLAEDGWVALLRKVASLYCGHAGSFCWKFLW